MSNSKNFNNFTAGQKKNRSKSAKALKFKIAVFYYIFESLKRKHFSIEKKLYRVSIKEMEFSYYKKYVCLINFKVNKNKKLNFKACQINRLYITSFEILLKKRVFRKDVLFFIYISFYTAFLLLQCVNKISFVNIDIE